MPLWSLFSSAADAGCVWHGADSVGTGGVRWDGGDALAGELRQHALGGRRFQAQWQWHPRLAYCLLHYPVNYLLCLYNVYQKTQ